MNDGNIHLVSPLFGLSSLDLTQDANIIFFGIVVLGEGGGQ